MANAHPNTSGLKPFQKGADPRRNTKRRPKSFDMLRKLAQEVAGEVLTGVDGADVTRVEALLRVMSSSRNPADRKTFLEYAYGKPKESVDITSNGQTLNWKDFIASDEDEKDTKTDSK